MSLSTIKKDTLINSIETKISSLFTSLTTQLINNQHLTITIGTSLLQFPGKTDRESWKFTVYVKLLHLIYQNLKERGIRTRRDLYYQDVQLFKNQRTVDDAIKNFDRLFEVESSVYGIVAARKGIVVGNLSIIFHDNHSQHFKYCDGPALIPLLHEVKYIFAKSDTKCIIVVEKEAVLKQLCLLDENHIIITGKGFPDKLTQSFLYVLHYNNPSIPIHAVVDSDPHGLSIYNMYRAGLQKNELGINSTEPRSYSAINYLGVHITDYSHGWVDLTECDIKVAVSSLSKNWVHPIGNRKVKEELQRQLFFGKKAEMNIVQGSSIHKYVEQKLAKFKCL